MKNSKKLFSVGGIVLCLFLTFSILSIAFAATADTSSAGGNTKILVDKFVEAINNNDVDTYISLFTKDNQEEMMSYAKINGKDNNC